MTSTRSSTSSTSKKTTITPLSAWVHLMLKHQTKQQIQARPSLSSFTLQMVVHWKLSLFFVRGYEMMTVIRLSICPFCHGVLQGKQAMSSFLPMILGQKLCGVSTSIAVMNHPPPVRIVHITNLLAHVQINGRHLVLVRGCLNTPSPGKMTSFSSSEPLLTALIPWRKCYCIVWIAPFDSCSDWSWWDQKSIPYMP